MENQDWLPRVDEPMEEYLRSERYRQHKSDIVFSDFQGQEESNYHFWRKLTPMQRLELHTIMVYELYGTDPDNTIKGEPFEIQFTEISL